MSVLICEFDVLQFHLQSLGYVLCQNVVLLHYECALAVALLKLGSTQIEHLCDEELDVVVLRWCVEVTHCAVKIAVAADETVLACLGCNLCTCGIESLLGPTAVRVEHAIWILGA